MNGKQLKNSILQWAIQGKLVPQDPNDEPASVLLEKIRAEKARLVKEGKLKKKDLEVKPITEEEILFEIPKGWEWVRWGELGEYKKGPFGSSLTKSMFVPKTDEAVKVYEQKNAIQKDYTLGEYYISKEKYETMIGFTVHPGDIIVSCAGTIGETYFLPPEAPIGIINQALMRAKLHLDSIIPYWLLYFQYILLVENKLKGSGSAIKNIPPFEVLKAMPVPFPPLAEQHRIVAKIEELMPMVEKYGAAQEALDEWNQALPEKLKKSILQEAIQGKLVPQDPADEPASVLLERIREEKKQLVKEGKLKKKDLEVKPIEEDEIPFEIPESWEWVRYQDIANCELGKTKNPNEPVVNLRPYLCAINVYWDKIDITKLKEMPFSESEMEKYSIKKGDMLICEGGEAGRTAIWKDENKTVFYQNALHRVRFYVDVEPYFYLYQMYLYKTAGYLNDYIKGETIQHFVLGKLQSLPIPLPPLAEQRRIVEKIEELFGVME